MIKAQTPKGFRDFLPSEALKRKYVQGIIETTFASYGFDPLETPALEYAETLTGKYGAEADKLLYLFKDNGGRDVGLRYDQTVPLSRVVAQYGQTLVLPFKRYQIQPVWRAENTQKGRYREFLQCDIDTIGSDSYLADAEIIACTIDGLKKIGFKRPQILINDRSIFDSLGLSKKEIIIIDKLDKIGEEAVIEELEKSGRKTAKELFDSIRSAVKTDRLQEIFKALEMSGFVEGPDFRFEPFLARGLDYYTSTIFEAKVLDLTTPLSIAGGGRYDTLIGTFSGRDIPAVGIAFGFDRIIEIATELGLLPAFKTSCQLLICPLGNESLGTALSTTAKLRDSDINTEVYPDPAAKLDKQLKYANKKGIPFVAILGENEVKTQSITLKNMTDGKQTSLKIDELKDITAYVKEPSLL
ncbi:histidine--tRNA ligase [Candidatus Collierbacteria bacterium]|nr:histidine--tRNA ligase [Candidatus Collierbacteria bacterium]